MSSNRDHLNDFFKENAHLLDEMPKNVSWPMLARRLQRDKHKRRVITILNIGMGVAASLLLVVNLLWVYSEITTSTSDSFVFIENYKNESQDVYKTQANEGTQLTYTSSVERDAPIGGSGQNGIQSQGLSVWNYGENTPKKIKELSAITGSWVLPAWYQLDQYKNIPKTINVFHTNDDRYYLNIDNDHHEAYLMKAIRTVDKFKVLHPQINVIDNSNNTVLIVYFDSGLIVDYQKTDSKNHISLL